jgi:hypothetical protein
MTRKRFQRAIKPRFCKRWSPWFLEFEDNQFSPSSRHYYLDLPPKINKCKKMCVVWSSVPGLGRHRWHFAFCISVFMLWEPALFPDVRVSKSFWFRILTLWLIPTENVTHCMYHHGKLYRLVSLIIQVIPASPSHRFRPSLLAIPVHQSQASVDTVSQTKQAVILKTTVATYYHPMINYDLLVINSV